MPFEPASDVLSPYTVLDLTRVRSGPTCVRQLADWGANVIKIEDPTDKAGLGGPRSGSDFQNLHRNKRSMTLNLKSKQGVEIFKKLAERVDIIVENYRPDVKKRLGIDYDSIRRNQSRVSSTRSISGFGQDGPLAGRPGFDQIAQGMGGLMSITGRAGPRPHARRHPRRRPVRRHLLLAGHPAGADGARALRQGAVGADITAAGAGVHARLPGLALAHGRRRARTGRQRSPDLHSDRRVQDLRRVHQSRRRRQAMWLKFKAHDERLRPSTTPTSPTPNRARRTARSSTLLSTAIRSSRPRPHWIATFNDAGVPSGEINNINQVFDLEQVRHLGLAQPMESQERGKTEVLGQPILMSRSKASVRRPPPTAWTAHERNSGRDRLRRAGCPPIEQGRRSLIAPMALRT